MIKAYLLIIKEQRYMNVTNIVATNKANLIAFAHTTLKSLSYKYDVALFTLKREISKPYIFGRYCADFFVAIRPIKMLGKDEKLYD